MDDLVCPACLKAPPEEVAEVTCDCFGRQNEAKSTPSPSSASSSVKNHEDATTDAASLSPRSNASNASNTSIFEKMKSAAFSSFKGKKKKGNCSNESTTPTQVEGTAPTAPPFKGKNKNGNSNNESTAPTAQTRRYPMRSTRGREKIDL